MDQHNFVQAAASAESELPVFDLGELRQSVQTVVNGKRIGKPVFVRLTIQGPDKHADILRKLALMADTASSWIAQPLDRLHAVGSLASGQVCLTLQFQGGASALISFARGRWFGDGVDLIVLGNHGAIHHDPGTGTLWQSLPDFKGAKPDARLSEAIEQALRSGKAISTRPKDE
jgi:hypothetical protein